MISLSRGTVRLLTTLAVVSIIFVSAMAWYYHQQNRAVDPRMVEVRQALSDYQTLLPEQEWDQAMAVLDKAEATVEALPAYADSFERGVIENDRAALYLLMLEHKLLAMGDEPEVDAKGRLLLERAEAHGANALDIYGAWLDRMGGESPGGIRAMLEQHFQAADPAFDGYDAATLLDKRVEEVIEARDEVPRRMSVTLTNLGVAARYAGNAPLAKERYERALELWPKNHAAEDNLDRLLGRKPKRRIIEKLFPPKR